MGIRLRERYRVQLGPWGHSLSLGPVLLWYGFSLLKRKGVCQRFSSLNASLTK